jgi:hypothetical protein
VLLVLGLAITGYHQASTIGLALIVLLQLKLNKVEGVDQFSHGLSCSFQRLSASGGEGSQV